MLYLPSRLLVLAGIAYSVSASPRYRPQRPSHGPLTGSHTTSTYDTTSSTYNNIRTMIHGPPPIVTPQSNTGGLFYAQTTMPTTTTTYGGQTSSFGDNQPTTTDYDDQPTTTSYSGSGNRVAVPSSEATGAGGWCPTTSSAAKCYRTAAEFPPTSQWMSLDCLINHSRPDMVGSSNDGPDEADDVIAAVQSVAQSAGIDARIPFALMMQESSGKVRPVIGDWGKSFGLFQVQIADAALCTGFAKNECPSSVIQNMVEEGIYGHNGTGSAPVAPGIAYWLGAEGGNVGRALRGYNTGRVDDPNDLTNIPSGGTKSYVSDVANRLIGGLLGAQHQYTCT